MKVRVTESESMGGLFVCLLFVVVVCCFIPQMSTADGPGQAKPRNQNSCLVPHTEYRSPNAWNIICCLQGTLAESYIARTQHTGFQPSPLTCCAGGPGDNITTTSLVPRRAVWGFVDVADPEDVFILFSFASLALHCNQLLPRISCSVLLEYFCNGS